MQPIDESTSNISQGSLLKLGTCHPDLIALVKLVSLKIPLMVLEGHRDEIAQQLAYDGGRSKLPWPNSLHNSLPSFAVDIAPLPYDPTNVKMLYFFGGYVLATSRVMGLSVRWGADWKQNLDFYHNKFDDLFHFELNPLPLFEGM